MICDVYDNGWNQRSKSFEHTLWYFKCVLILTTWCPKKCERDVDFNHWPLGDFFDKRFSSYFQWLMVKSFMTLPSEECHWTRLIISQHWFRLWLGSVGHRAIARANVGPDLCRHMASLGHNRLTIASMCVYFHDALLVWSAPRYPTREAIKDFNPITSSSRGS